MTRGTPSQGSLFDKALTAHAMGIKPQTLRVVL